MNLSSRMAGVKPSAIMEMLKAAQAGGGVNFASGLPDPALFPVEALTRAADAVLSEAPGAALQYGPAEGYAPLREWVAARLRARGLKASVESVLITHGSQQALDLAARAFVDPGDPVAIESPTYLAALQTFDSLGASYRPIAHRECGLDPDDATTALPDTKLFYVLPTFQNPSGRTMPLGARERLAAAIADANVPLLEDDAYFDLRFEGEQLPPLSSLAPGVALYTSTFSKIISPGLRVGFIHGPPALIERLTCLKQITDLHTSSLAQRVVYRYVTENDLDAHVATIRATYGSRLKVMLAALEREMPKGVRWTRPAGGMFLWLTLPIGIDAAALLGRAQAAAVLFVPGAGFHPGGGAANTLRLNFASPGEAEIERGIEILAAAVRCCRGE